jgi:hypothetical protein
MVSTKAAMRSPSSSAVSTEGGVAKGARSEWMAAMFDIVACRVTKR